MSNSFIAFIEDDTGKNSPLLGSLAVTLTEETLSLARNKGFGGGVYVQGVVASRLADVLWRGRSSVSRLVNKNAAASLVVLAERLAESIES